MLFTMDQNQQITWRVLLEKWPWRYSTDFPPLCLKVVRWPPAGHQAQGSALPVRLHRRVQPTVCGLLPFPLLCLHVSCHHLWRAAGRGDRRPNSKSSPYVPPQKDLLCSAQTGGKVLHTAKWKLSVLVTLFSASCFPRVLLSHCLALRWQE